MKCIEDEIPFEVPEGWSWAKLKHICMMAAGKSKPTNQIKAEPFDDCYPCFGGNGIRGYVDEYNQDGTFSIVGRQGALCGNINIASGKFYATEHAVVTTVFSGIDFNWSNYILEALNLNEYATGAAQPGLSVANILNVFVPVPPTQEQVHIGNRIAESIKIIENIAAEKDNLQILISTTKSKILDLAIRGQLVPQNPEDEPASILLERIRAEKEELIKQGKIKRDKKESIIFKGEDNSYYETIKGKCVCIDNDLPLKIPFNWTWSKIDNIAFVTKLAGFEYTENIAPNLCKNGIPLFKGKNVQDSTIIYEFEAFIPEDVSDELSRSQITRKCILTPYVGTIGNIGIHNKPGKYHLGSNVGKIELYNDNIVLLEEYVVAYLQSSYGYQQLTKHMKATAQPSISIEAIRDVYIPIPPEKEQKEIVWQLQNISSKFKLISDMLS